MSYKIIYHKEKDFFSIESDEDDDKLAKVYFLGRSEKLGHDGQLTIAEHLSMSINDALWKIEGGNIECTHVSINMLNNDIFWEVFDKFNDVYIGLENMMEQGYFLTDEVIEALNRFNEERNPDDDTKWIWEE